MSFLSVLKTIGHDVSVGVGVASKALPLLMPAVVALDPALASIAPVVSFLMTSVQRAEAIASARPGTMTGPDKQNFVMDELDNALPLLLAGLGAAGKTIDTTTVKLAARSLIDAIVAVLNAASTFTKVAAPVSVAVPTVPVAVSATVAA